MKVVPAAMKGWPSRVSVVPLAPSGEPKDRSSAPRTQQWSAADVISRLAPACSDPTGETPAMMRTGVPGTATGTLSVASMTGPSPASVTFFTSRGVPPEPLRTLTRKSARKGEAAVTPGRT